jgi:phosphoadenosine phosphosulfate reductase
LAEWDRPRIWDYVRAHDVPYNPLHERGYPSIGCTHCTAPVSGAGVDQYTRAGRWSGSEKTECGLHFDGRGI